VLTYVEVKTSAWHSKDAFEVSPAEMRWAQYHGPAYTVRTAARPRALVRRCDERASMGLSA